MTLTKTHWTLIIALVVALGNAIVPFLPADIADIIAAILSAVALTFHTQDVKTALNTPVPANGQPSA